MTWHVNMHGLVVTHSCSKATKLEMKKVFFKFKQASRIIRYKQYSDYPMGRSIRFGWTRIIRYS